MNDIVYEILRHAVNIARNEQIEKKKDLVDRLNKLYPDNQEEIGQALDFWSRNIVV